jgi:hypothetical protein
MFGAVSRPASAPPPIFKSSRLSVLQSIVMVFSLSVF